MRFFKSNRKTDQTDADLIADYKKTGNNTSIEILFDRYSHLVYAICLKYLKDEEESRDAVLTIFEKLLTSLRKYEVNNFTTWIHSVTRNHCLAQLQGKSKRHEENLNEDASFPVEPADIEEEQMKTVELTKLSYALTLLNKEQRTCVELFYLQKQCYAEIAEVTGYSLNQVKSYIQNGKRNLKIYLTNK